MPSGIYIRRPMSKETRLKISLANKGKHKLKGIDSPFWNGGKPKCLDCNEQLSSYRAIRCKVCAGKLRKFNDSHRQKIRLSKLGNKNPRWKEIKKPTKYPYCFNRTLKNIILKRDKYTCKGKNCNITQEEHFLIYKRSLEVHHIDYNRKNCKISNLITACKKCNIRANSNRKYWKDYFRGELEREVRKK